MFNVTDGEGGYDILGGATNIAVTEINGGHYALVVARVDNGVQIIDITDPSAPSPDAAITDGAAG